jgi:enamine deaminase RidA (YjgF/YER057c/UK114 family)
MSEIESRLHELGWALPQLRAPIGVYRGATLAGDMLFVSGHGPIQDGQRVYQGKIGGDLTVEDGCRAAELTIVNALRTVKEAIGDLDRVQRIVKVLGFVNSAPDFFDQPEVIDAASTLLVKAFGERGEHSRTAVGMFVLPFNLSVEIEMVVQVAKQT